MNSVHTSESASHPSALFQQHLHGKFYALLGHLLEWYWGPRWASDSVQKVETTSYYISLQVSIPTKTCAIKPVWYSEFPQRGATLSNVPVNYRHCSIAHEQPHTAFPSPQLIIVHTNRAVSLLGGYWTAPHAENTASSLLFSSFKVLIVLRLRKLKCQLK